jgi:predicted RNase H-like HicB family nuclease
MNRIDRAEDQTDYSFTIRPLTPAEGGGYLIEFPDLPGCMSDGETVAEAVVNGMDAKADWIAAMRTGRRSERGLFGKMAVKDAEDPASSTGGACEAGRGEP